MEKFDQIIEELKSEAIQVAIDEMISDMPDTAYLFWQRLKDKIGERGAAIAVLRLLQEAADDGAIVATTVTQSDDPDEFRDVIIDIDQFDDDRLSIWGTNTWIEVARKSNGELLCRASDQAE